MHAPTKRHLRKAATVTVIAGSLLTGAVPFALAAMLFYGVMAQIDKQVALAKTELTRPISSSSPSRGMLHLHRSSKKNNSLG